LPEVTSDASSIIAVSWQALARAQLGNERTQVCDCTVVVVFAAFFIESTLNHFIEVAGRKKDISPAPGEHDGLHRKLAWVYDNFMAHPPNTNQTLPSAALEDAFPGFEAIRKFRNDVSHGIIDRSVATLPNALRLRSAAKAIVNRLLDVARDNDIAIERAVEYSMAISAPET
jgi:hypothetical protein